MRIYTFVEISEATVVRINVLRSPKDKVIGSIPGEPITVNEATEQCEIEQFSLISPENTDERSVATGNNEEKRDGRVENEGTADPNEIEQIVTVESVSGLKFIAFIHLQSFDFRRKTTLR